MARGAFRGTDGPDGLPDGKPIETEAAKWFREQAKEILGTIPPNMTEIPDSFPPLADYDDPMSRAMTPIIASYWQESGDETTGRLAAASGLDLDEWKVTNPHLRTKIEEAAFKFCHKTNQTTGKDLDHALVDLRRSLAEGIVDKGEAPRELRKRVSEIFTGLETWGAQRIALTEASRAVHAAQLQAAEQSGVVAGLEWLLSDDACPMCKRQAEQCKRIRLGQAFAVVGSDPDYSVIRHPPLHPNDQCTVIEILLPAYGGPEDVEWGETLTEDSGYEKASKPAQKMPKAPEAEVPKVSNPSGYVPGSFRETGSGGPILPDRPIAERIAAYSNSVGDEKLQALRSAIPFEMAEVAARKAQYEALRSDYRKAVDDLHYPRTDAEFEADAPRLEALKAKKAEIQAQLKALEAKGLTDQEAARAAVAKVLAVNDPLPMAVRDPLPGSPLWKTDKLKEPEAALDAEIRKGLDWLGGMVRNDGRDKFEFGVGQFQEADRAFHLAYANVIALDGFDRASTVVHELGHALENNFLADAKELGSTRGKAVRQFLEHRVGDEPLSSFKKVIDKSYQKDEKGRKDRFDEAFGISGWYVGKDQPNASEILSMGIEKLHDDPLTLISKDPEYAKFVMGILDGSLR